MRFESQIGVPLTFIWDPAYHARNVANALLVIELAANGWLHGVEVDPELLLARYRAGGSESELTARPEGEPSRIPDEHGLI